MRSVRHFFPRWSQLLLNTRVVWGTNNRPTVETAYRPDPRASQAWRALYVAALFEPDEGRMVERIGEAKKALVVRARELFQTGEDHVQERSAIEDTLQSLHALEQCMAHPGLQPR